MTAWASHLTPFVHIDSRRYVAQFRQKLGNYKAVRGRILTVDRPLLAKMFATANHLMIALLTGQTVTSQQCSILLNPRR